MQRVDVGGFDEVMIEAGGLRSGAVFLLAPAGQRYKGHGPTPRLLTNMPGDFVAVQFGKADVQQHQLRAERVRNIYGLKAVVAMLYRG